MEKTIRIKTKENFGLNELELTLLKLPDVEFNGKIKFIHFTVKLNNRDFSNLLKFNETEHSRNYDFENFEEIIFIITYPDGKIIEYPFNLIYVSKIKYSGISVEENDEYAEFSIRVK